MVVFNCTRKGSHIGGLMPEFRSRSHPVEVVFVKKEKKTKAKAKSRKSTKTVQAILEEDNK